MAQAVGGGLLEQSFMTAMLKSGGDLLAFFQRPIAATLGVITLLVWLTPLALRLFHMRPPGLFPSPGGTSKE